MERKKYPQLLNRSSLIISGLVLLFHAVGLYGFMDVERTATFIKLVPMHLLLMLALMLISQQEKNRNFLFFVVVIYIAGYLIEFLGVHTGLIFGEYRYGPTLGFKLAEIPLLIGVNWVLLIYSVGVSVEALGLKCTLLKSVLGASVLVLLDFLIEPVAIHFNYWDWASATIPLQNYIAWFLFSFAGCWLFNRLTFNKVNLAASVLLIAQFLFFIGLNIMR